MRSFFRAARHVRHQYNAVIRQFVKSEHRFFLLTDPESPAAKYNTNPVSFYRLGGRNTRPEWY
jgi:hypothetical protein